MSTPVETRQLARGLGFLERYSRCGEWTWRRWDKRLKKRVAVRTRERNESRARQFVLQQSTLHKVMPEGQRVVAVLFETVVRDMLTVRKSGNGCKMLRSSTFKRYGTALNAFRLFLDDKYPSLRIDDVDAVLLTSFVKHLSQNVCATTANGYLDCVGQVVKHAIRKGCISKNPLPETERIYNNKGLQELSAEDTSIVGYACPRKEEVQQIIMCAPRVLESTGARAFNGSRAGRPVVRGINSNDYSCLYSALALTGMRIGEARFLTWDDVNLKRKIIMVRPGLKNGIFWQPKTRSSIRRIPIVPSLEDILDRQRQANRRNRWVFETRTRTQLSPGHPTARFRQICDALGYNKKYVVHSLRKYWASTVAQQGMETKLMIKAFGHSDLKLIMSVYYAQNDDERLVAEASRIDFGLAAENRPRGES